MPEVDFRIKYGGGEAEEHIMDMRLLALSMLGAERIVSDGLVILTHRRLPKRGERAPVIVKAREPTSGSVELVTFFHTLFGTLDLGLPLAKRLAGSFIEEWWKAIIARFAGKHDIAETAIQALVDLNKEHLAARDNAEIRHHEEIMALIDLYRAGVASQQRPAEQFVAPIGPSVTTATVYPSLASPVSIDAGQAEAIRESANLSWGPLEELTLKTDGFRFHTNGLSIQNPDRDGYLMARVRDPRFKETVNPYTEAAQRRAEVIVLGRRGYKDKKLAGIDIVDLFVTIRNLDRWLSETKDRHLPRLEKSHHTSRTYIEQINWQCRINQVRWLGSDIRLERAQCPIPQVFPPISV